MANKRLNVQEKFRIITECRQSGLSDQQWCLENGIKSSTFYTWISRLRELPDIEIPKSKSRLEYLASSKQDVVPLEIASKQHDYKIAVENHSVFHETISNDMPAMEVTVGELKIRFTNSVDPNLLAMTFRLLKESRC